MQEKLLEVSLSFIVFGKSHKSFFWRRKVEKLVLKLVETTMLEDYHNSLKILNALEILLRLSEELHYVDLENANNLLKEIGLFKLLLSGSDEERVESVDKSEVVNNSITASSLEDLIKNARSRSLIGNMANSSSVSVENVKDSGDQSMRQSAIVDLIRQSGNCRMKDLMASFPDTSERTLRNDLQKICEQGLARRVGNGGAYTFYTAKL